MNNPNLHLPHFSVFPLEFGMIDGFSVEVVGLWFFLARIQSGFTNCESNPDPVPTRFKQSDSCLSPEKKVKQRISNVFSVKTKSNPDPVARMITSLLILLEAAGVRVQKIQNPVLAHIWLPAEVAGVIFSDCNCAHVPEFLKPLSSEISIAVMPRAVYSSDFQPVFRGKLVFHERSSGVPQEIW